MTSTLVLLGSAAATDGSGCHLYAIDGRGGPALAIFESSPWCGGVVRLHERERVIRLVNRLGDEIARRIADPQSPRFPIVVLVDGLDALRHALDDLETIAEFEALETILALGPANDVILVCAVERVGALPASVLASCAQRWVFHLADPLDAVGLGISPADVPGPQPGRVFVVSARLEAQLMHGSAPLPSCVVGVVPGPVECLPTVMRAVDLPPGSCRGDDSLLPIGMRFGDVGVCAIDVPDGEHIMVIGPPRSGRSTALQRLVLAWLDAHPEGWWRTVAPRRSALDDRHRYRSLAEIIEDVPDSGPVLIAIDDAELVDDVGGVLAGLATSRRAGLMIIATGKPDSLRQSYGHWTGMVRRSRLGLVTSASNDLDGDLLGAVLPRRLPIAARPGLAWLVSDGEVVLMQVATDSATKMTPQLAQH